MLTSHIFVYLNIKNRYVNCQLSTVKKINKQSVSSDSSLTPFPHFFDCVFGFLFVYVFLN